MHDCIDSDLIIQYIIIMCIIGMIIIMISCMYVWQPHISMVAEGKGKDISYGTPTYELVSG